MIWDLFICHASEDKEAFVRPLVTELQKLGLRVWYDEFTLRIGDSLRRKIDHGLSQSKAGVVVLSPWFFAKEWPQRELDGLVARETGSVNIVLPVWHEIERTGVLRYLPTLADRVALSSSLGVAAVAARLSEALHASQARPVASDSSLPTLAVGPDGDITQTDRELDIAIQEALSNAEAGVDPPLLLTVCAELLWEHLNDREPLRRLGFPWSLDILRRLDALGKKPSLTLDEREERLWCAAINNQVTKVLSLIQTAVSALLSEPVLRNSGYLHTPRDLALAVRGTVSRAFWNGEVPSGYVKLDL